MMLTWCNRLRSLWQDNWGVYGARKLWHAARRAGHDIGRDQVARLMRLAGITGTVRGKHRTITTRRDETAARHPDLVKRGWLAPTGLDQLWVVADFSYSAQAAVMCSDRRDGVRIPVGGVVVPARGRGCCT